MIPIFERLWDVAACTLDLNECKSLVLWAVKTAMVLEPMNEPNHWLYTDLERTLLWKCESVPEFTNVWIAKCVDWPSIYSVSRILSTAIGGASERGVRAAVTTLAFGNLAIQVRKLVFPEPKDPAMDITVEERKGPWERTMLQVWPPEAAPVHWPAEMGINGELGLESLEVRFSPPYEAATPVAWRGFIGSA